MMTRHGKGLGAILFSALGLAAQTWTLAQPITSPGPRYLAAAAAGDTGSPLLMFGGTSGSGVLGETWVWSNAQWQSFTPATSPSPRSGAAIAYDRQRRRFLLFGGRGAGGTRLADTWAFDGSNWIRLLPAASPAARDQAAICYDRARDRVVLFGGSGAASTLGDTWEWNGSTWQQRTDQGPSARSGATMVFDVANQNILVFGGLGPGGPLADTFTLNQSGWLFQSGAGPAARFGACATYEPVQNRVLLCGGRGVGSVLLSDAWLWSNRGWVPTLAPSGARAHAAMAFDAEAACPVMFGGEGSSGPLSDTQLRSPFGTTPSAEWSQVHPAGPPHRSAQGMTFDAARNVTVVFGGYWSSVAASVFGTRSDCWTWNGTTWTQVAGGPPGRYGPGMCFDGLRNRVVMFGGLNAASAAASVVWRDTWEWDGTSWSLRATSGPPASYAPAMAFDSSRCVTVLFGGQSASGAHDETWEWDGTAWLRRTPAVSPPAASSMAAAFDATRARTVLHGGYSSTAVFNTTWEWDGNTWLAAGGSEIPRDAFPEMVWDPQRCNLVLVSGDGLRTWDRIGSTWVERAERQAEPRMEFRVAYDTARQRIVRFGGVRMASAGLAAFTDPQPTDTWECRTQPNGGVTGTAIEFGAACNAARIRFQPFAGYRPAVGGELLATAEYPTTAPTTLTSTTWVSFGHTDRVLLASGQPLPLSLDVLNLPGCLLLHSMDIDAAMPTIEFGTYGPGLRTASLRTRLPNVPAIIGRLIFGQAWGFDPTGPQPFMVGNAIEWRIGSH